ncbi:MAG TPA: hypothetical protein VK731_06850, partial [Candidatus Cybelea sp.]|nr:hypothetical protein [Candidatus Cybelea sp.]
MLVRIFVSSREESFYDLIATLTHEIARLPITIATIVPEGIGEEELLEIAARQSFDLAVLFLNNILYSSGRRERLADDSVALVQKMARLFLKPIIGVYGWPDSPDYPSRILAAGATEVFQAPFKC